MSICDWEFRRGQHDRLGRELSRGISQLRQVREVLTYQMGQIGELRSLLQMNMASLRPKVPKAARDNLKRLPELISYLLGWSFLPAVAALAGDDIPPEVVAELNQHALTNANAIVERCVGIHRRFHNSVRLEMICLKYGETDLEIALRDSIKLVDDVLRRCAV